MKKIALILTIFSLLFFFALAPLSFSGAPGLLIAQAQPDSYGLYQAADQAGIARETNFPTTIGQILFYAVSMIGAIFFILMVYGGFLWMTAGGSSEKTKKAMAIMRNGAIGVVIVLSAYAITRFVIIDILVNSGQTTTNNTQTQQTQ